MAGVVGVAILFFSLLVAAVVVGAVLFPYAAYCIIVVVSGTAAGSDAVKWPGLPFLDWAGRFFYLAWLIAIALVPAWVITLLATPDLEGMLRLVPLLLAVWLLFPVLLLSALSAQHPILIFHTGFFRRLKQQAGALGVFYFLTAPLLVSAAALGLLGIRYGLAVLIAAPAGAALFLIYARLLGRLAWLVGARTSVRKPRQRKKEKGRATRPEVRGSALADQWNRPSPDDHFEDLSASDAGAAPEGAGWSESLHALAAGLPPDAREDGFPQAPAEAAGAEAAGAEAADAEHDEWALARKPYAVEETPALVEPPQHREPIPPDRQIMEWVENRKPAPPPRHPFFTGVFSFPWYDTSLRAWANLSLLGLLWAWLVRGMIATFPF